MLLPLKGRTACYDLVGPEQGEVVVFAHSLAADGGMWTEQMPPLLAAGYRVLRIDMRGHGGSTPTPAPYTIDLLADDIVVVLDALGIKADVYAIGCGIGQSKEAKMLLCEALQRQVPLVLDADALNLIARDADLQNDVNKRKSPTVLDRKSTRLNSSHT